MRLSESYPEPNEKIAGPFSATVQTLCAALDEMQKLLALSYSRDEMDWLQYQTVYQSITEIRKNLLWIYQSQNADINQ